MHYGSEKAACGGYSRRVTGEVARVTCAACVRHIEFTQGSAAVRAAIQWFPVAANPPYKSFLSTLARDAGTTEAAVRDAAARLAEYAPATYAYWAKEG